MSVDLWTLKLTNCCSASVCVTNKTPIPSSFVCCCWSENGKIAQCWHFMYRRRARQTSGWYRETKNLKIHLKEFVQQPANVYFCFSSVKLVEKETQTMRTCFVSLSLFSFSFLRIVYLHWDNNPATFWKHALDIYLHPHSYEVLVELKHNLILKDQQAVLISGRVENVKWRKNEW